MSLVQVLMLRVRPPLQWFLEQRVPLMVCLMALLVLV
jgi:hypothetical protein